MSDFTGGAATGDIGGNCPPILWKNGPWDFFKIEGKVAGYRMSKNISKKCLKTRFKKVIELERDENGKKLILAHTYAAKFSKLPF